MKKDNSKPKTEVAVTETAPTKPVEKSESRPLWSVGRIFWGLLFVAVGVAFLLQNLNIVDLELQNLALLWPLIFVIIGISIMSLRGVAMAIVGLVAGAAIIGLITMVLLGWAGPNRDVQTTQASIERSSDNAKTLELDVATGAGKLSIESVKDGPLVAANLESNFLTLNQESSETNNVQQVAITVDNRQAGPWWIGNFRNDLTVKVDDDLPAAVTVKAGASDIKADFTDLDLRSLNIDAGASSIELRFGALASDLDVTLEAGASSVTIYVPKDVGVSALIEGGLNSSNLEGLSEVSDDYYESAGYKDAKRTIDIRGDMGVSSVTLKRY